jgi:hypothetical protein
LRYDASSVKHPPARKEGSHLRATRRRQRRPDSLASPEAIRAICQKLREKLPDSIPSREMQLLRFLHAVRHVERRPATDTKRGRPGRWSREELTQAARVLRSLLTRETSGRVSVSSFIGQYLPILQFPSDVAGALADGRINLHEAAQLARLTPERLGFSLREARRAREETLKAHLAVQGSQTRLRERVKEMLGGAEATRVSSQEMATVLARADELLEVDPTDTRHLFWEEMKRIFFALREVRAEDLDEPLMEELMAAVDQISNVLHKIERRRKREQNSQTLQI